MNSILEEKTTLEEDDINTNISKKEEENDIKNRLRKNPQKTQPLYQLEKTKKNSNAKVSKIKDNELKIIKSILDKIKTHQKSLYFRFPAIRSLPNKKQKEYYKSIVHHPQDLGNITKKFNHKKYNTYQEFYDDLNLVWDNAQLFNEEKAIVYKDAEYMRKYTNKLFKEKNIYNEVEHIEKDSSVINEHTDSINTSYNIDETNQNNSNSNNDSLIGKKRNNEKDNNDEEDNENDSNIKNIKNIEIHEESSDKNINVKSTEDSKKTNKISYITSSNYFKKTYNNKYLNDNLDYDFNEINKISESEKTDNSKHNNNGNGNDNEKSVLSNLIENIENSNKNNKNDKEKENEKNKKLLNQLNSSENNLKTKKETTRSKSNLKNKYKDRDKDKNNDKNKKEDKEKIDKKNINKNISSNDTKDEIKEKEKENQNDNHRNNKNYINQISDNDYKYKKENEYNTKDLLFQYGYLEIMKKKEEEIMNYKCKIAKELDRLKDEQMFDLLEFIEDIRPEAVIEIDDTVNIDMTRFIEDTFIQVYNFIKHIKVNNSLI